MSFEFPLVFFTVFTQLGAGADMFLCWHMFTNASPDYSPAIKKAWICITAISCIGVIASFFHLGHPFAAYKALYNLGASWLSREGLAFACFCFMAFINIFRSSKFLALITALLGAFGLFAQGMTYSPPSIPALNNVMPMAIFWLSALAMGGCAMAVHLGYNNESLVRLLVLALLVILLAGPAIWISETPTMRESGLLWAGSFWFWAGIALVAAAFAATWLHAKRNPKLRMICLLCGIICTRMVFFVDTAHTAANLGLPFN